MMVCCAVVFASVFQNLVVQAADRLTFDPKLDSEQRKRAEALWFAMKASREQIRSGVFSGKGTLVDADSGLGRLEGPVSVLCYFNFPERSLRFESTWPSRHFDVGDGKITADTPWHTESPLQVTIITDGRAAEWNASVPASMHIKNAKSSGRTMDVRSFGLDSLSGYNGYHPFEVLARAFEGQMITGISNVDDRGDVVRVVWMDEEKSLFRRTIWFNVAEGYTPIRKEVAFHKGSADDWTEARIVHEVTWQRISDVWVPKTIAAMEYSSTPAEATTLHLNLEWQKVNEQIPAGMLKDESIGITHSTLVVDHRLDKPVVTDLLFPDGTRKAPIPPGNDIVEKRGDSYRKGMWAIVVCVNLVLLVGAGVAVWYVRRRRR